MRLLFCKIRFECRQKHFFVKRFFKLEIKFVGVFIMNRRRFAENGRKVNCVRAVSNSLLSHSEHFGVTDEFVNGANAEFCHYFAKFFRDKQHKIHNVFGFAAESFSEFGVLRCNTDGTGIKVAYAHHNTAHGNQRSSCKAEFLRAEQAGNGNISAAHKFAVRFKSHARTKPVFDKRLMRFRKSEFPRKSRIMYRTLGSCARAAVVT